MALYADALGLPLVHAGKVRELYALDGDRLLMVATDRISAFDHVLEPLVPDKGVILNHMSLWWFDRLADLVDSHVISTAVPDAVAGRAVVCERLTMVPVECVARGYLTGSGWLEYQASGSVCGVGLPEVWSTGRRCRGRSSPRRPRPRWASTTRTSTSPPWSPRSVRTSQSAYGR
jgi:phosphoribosylaminoimidazole-succinocarboxamide synthase